MTEPAANPSPSALAQRSVPEDIPRPVYARAQYIFKDDPYHGDPWTGDGMIKLGSEDEQRLRRTARLARDVLEFAGTLVKPGITTDDIDAAVHSFIVKNRAYPSPLTYGGFPKSCCTSVNNIIVHGIPDDRPLEHGDIVNIDVTVFREGHHGDTSKTFLVGNVDGPGRHLVSLSSVALEAGIAACAPGRPLKDIGAAIHEVCRAADAEALSKHKDRQEEDCDSEAWTVSVSPQYTGHVIGEVFHRPPWILHHRNDEPGFMKPGHCFTIEPALVQGSDPQGWLFPDNWTVSTTNGARSAQAEHMVLITESGVDVLTR